MPTQKSTQSTALTLAPQQGTVICAIAQGASVSDATRQAGVDRTTFYLWMKDPEFEAELNRVKQEHSDYTRALLRGLADTAVNTVREVLTEPNVPPAVRLQAAMTVLRAIGTLEPERIGPTDAHSIHRSRSLRGISF